MLLFDGFMIHENQNLFGIWISSFWFYSVCFAFVKRFYLTSLCCRKFRFDIYFFFVKKTLFPTPCGFMMYANCVAKRMFLYVITRLLLCHTLNRILNSLVE